MPFSFVSSLSTVPPHRCHDGLQYKLSRLISGRPLFLLCCLYPGATAPPSPACLPRVAAASAAEALAPSESEGAATAPPSGVGAEAPSLAGQRIIYGRRRGIHRVGDEAKAVVRAGSTPGEGAGTSTAPPGSRPFQQQLPVVGRCEGAGRSGAGGSGGASPSRVVALAKMQWTEVADAFSCHQQLVRVVGCEVVAPQLIVRTGLHKEVRKKVRLAFCGGRPWWRTKAAGADHRHMGPGADACPVSVIHCQLTPGCKGGALLRLKITSHCRCLEWRVTGKGACTASVRRAGQRPVP